MSSQQNQLLEQKRSSSVSKTEKTKNKVPEFNDDDDDSTIPTAELLMKIDIDLKHLQGQRNILQRAREGKKWKHTYSYNEKSNNAYQLNSPIKCSSRCKISSTNLYNVLQKIRYVNVADSFTQIGSSLSKLNLNENIVESNIDQIDRLVYDKPPQEKINIETNRGDTYRKNSKRNLSPSNRTLRLKSHSLENKKKSSKLMNDDNHATPNATKYKKTRKLIAPLDSSGSSHGRGLKKTRSSIRRHAELEKEILEYASQKQKKKELQSKKKRSKDLNLKDKSLVISKNENKEENYASPKSRLLKMKTNGNHSISIYNHDTFIIVDSGKAESHHAQNDSRKLDPKLVESEKNDFTESSFGSNSYKFSSTGSNIIDDSTYVCPKNSEENNFLILPYVPNISVSNTLSPSEEIISEYLEKSPPYVIPNLAEQHENIAARKRAREKLLSRNNKYKTKELNSTWESHINQKGSENSHKHYTGIRTQDISSRNQPDKSPSKALERSLQPKSVHSKREKITLEPKEKSASKSQSVNLTEAQVEKKNKTENVSKFVNIKHSNPLISKNVQAQNQPVATNSNDIILKGIIDSETGTSVILQSWSNNQLQTVSIQNTDANAEIPKKTPVFKEREEPWGDIESTTDKSHIRVETPSNFQETRIPVQYERREDLNTFGLMLPMKNTSKQTQTQDSIFRQGNSDLEKALISKLRDIERKYEISKKERIEDLTQLIKSNKNLKFAHFNKKEEEINLKILSDSPTHKPQSITQISKLSKLSETNENEDFLLKTFPFEISEETKKIEVRSQECLSWAVQDSKTNTFLTQNTLILKNSTPLEIKPEISSSTKNTEDYSFYKHVKTSGKLTTKEKDDYLNFELDNDESEVDDSPTFQQNKSDGFCRKSAITVVFREAMEKLTPKLHRSLNYGGLGAIPKLCTGVSSLNSNTFLNNNSILQHEKLEMIREKNQQKSVNFCDVSESNEKYRMLSDKDETLQPQSTNDLSEETTKPEENKLHGLSISEILRSPTFDSEFEKRETKIPSGTQYSEIISKNYDIINSSFQESSSKLGQNSNFIPEALKSFEEFNPQKQFNIPRETQSSIATDSEKSDVSSTSKSRLIFPQSLESKSSMKSTKNNQFHLQKHSSPIYPENNTPHLIPPEQRPSESLTLQLPEIRTSRSDYISPFHSSYSKEENEDNEEYVDSEDNGEVTFLSDTFIRENPIDGVPEPISDFIHHLENRVKDCEQRVKIQTRGIEKIVNRCALKREIKQEHYSEDDAMLQSSYHSLLEMDKSASESSFEEIPPFTGCECMRKDYYEIMKIAYRKF